MSIFDFIPNHARIINNSVPGKLCEETINMIIRDFEFFPCYYNNELNLKYRDSSEVKITDKNITNKFWEHIKKYVPTKCDGEKLIGPHYSSVYLIRYCEEQFFKKHCDIYSKDSNGNVSKITVIIYLNDVENIFGGQTTFYSKLDKNIIFASEYKDKSLFNIIPRIGKLVLFTHSVIYEEKVVKIGYKYCIKFNILYSTTFNKKIKLKLQEEVQRKIRKNKNMFNMYNKSYKKPNKIQKTSEYRFKCIKKFTEPSSNGLKYKTKQMIVPTTNEVIILNTDPNNKESKNRWIDVIMRHHVFKIKKNEYMSFVDTTQGRPPTWGEDFCPNCYEILPLINTYINCSGCMYPVVSIDNARRNENLNIHKLTISSYIS